MMDHDPRRLAQIGRCQGCRQQSYRQVNYKMHASQLLFLPGLRHRIAGLLTLVGLELFPVDHHAVHAVAQAAMNLHVDRVAYHLYRAVAERHVEAV